MERQYQDEQRVKVVGTGYHDESDMGLMGQVGTVRSFDSQTSLYMVDFDNGRISPFYGQELEAAQ